MCVRLIIKISGGKSFFFLIKNQWVKSGAHFLPTDFSIHLAQSVWLKRRKKKRKEEEKKHKTKTENERESWNVTSWQHH